MKRREFIKVIAATIAGLSIGIPKPVKTFTWKDNSGNGIDLTGETIHPDAFKGKVIDIRFYPGNISNEEIKQIHDDWLKRWQKLQIEREKELSWMERLAKGSI